MEPIEFLRVLRRRWRVIIACVLVAVIAALVVNPGSGRSPKAGRHFKASATLLADALKRNNSSNSQMTLSQDALVIKIGVVPRRSAVQLGFTGNPQRLVSQITTTMDPKVGTIAITSTQPTAARAVAVVNTFAEQLIGYLRDVAQGAFNLQVVAALGHQRTLERLYAQVQSQVTAQPNNAILLARKDSVITEYRLAAKSYQTLVNGGVDTSRYRVIEATNGVPIAKSGLTTSALGGRSTRAMLAVLIGLVLGAGIAMLLDRFDLRVRTKEDAEDAFGLPVVSEIPALWYPTRRKREVITAVRPISPYAEVHRILRHSLLFAHMSPWSAVDTSVHGGVNGNGNGNGSDGPKTPWHAANAKGRQVIVVTSAGSAEGKTTTVANLAASFAESGQSVLVMSCDFHGPRIQEMLGAGDAPGIANVLHGGANAPSLADVTVETSIPGVWLAPSGDGIDNPPELASSVGSLMTAARQLADVVIVDTPALLSVSAASELLPAADVAVIVARSSRTTREAAVRVHERLEFLGAPVLGVVLVGPQIPSVSREYSGYSRPPGGWRKRRKLIRKRGVQIGARAETLERTHKSLDLPVLGGGRTTTAVLEHTVADAANGDTETPAGDLTAKPRWRRRESHREE
ncbi:MAG TPA: P-loop NTPase [Acidimicrobiia bacterium]